MKEFRNQNSREYCKGKTFEEAVVTSRLQSNVGYERTVDERRGHQKSISEPYEVLLKRFGSGRVREMAPHLLCKPEDWSVDPQHPVCTLRFQHGRSMHRDPWTHWLARVAGVNKQWIRVRDPASEQKVEHNQGRHRTFASGLHVDMYTCACTLAHICEPTHLQIHACTPHTQTLKQRFLNTLNRNLASYLWPTIYFPKLSLLLPRNEPPFLC